ncbi:MAG: hypothetical protein E7034_08775 [Akkermansiaceae bacterium]|nr:hypothetical protein [Akkermansiaceae bacterium]
MKNINTLFLSSAIVLGGLFVVYLLWGLTLIMKEQQLTGGSLICLASSFLCGVLCGIYKTMWKKYPQRAAMRLWNLSQPGNCAICVSAHQWEQTLVDGRKRKRSSVSEGQILALPHVVNSLNQAYGDRFSWVNLFNSHTPRAAAAFAAEDDLILIGGSVTNPQTGAVLNLIRNRVDIKYTHEWLQVEVHRGQDRGTYRYDIERNGTIDDGIFEVTKDYAIILHVTVRGAVRNRKIVVLAGCTTLGTGGAGQFFCSRMVDNEKWQKNGDKDYVAILSCPYVNNRCDMENTKVEEFINI